MNDITFAASRLAAHRAYELERDVAQRRANAQRAAECVLPPVREHPRVRFPWLSIPLAGGIHSARPAV